MKNSKPGRPLVDALAETPGEILARLRGAAGWSRYRLAKASGVDAGTIAGIEAGRTGCTLETALKLVGALGVSLSGLIRQAGD